MLVPVNPRILALHCLTQGGTGIEIGVHEGNFSANILNVVKPSKFYLIDPWRVSDSDKHQPSLYSSRRVTQNDMDERYNRVLQKFEKNIKVGVVHVIRDSSENCADQFSESSIDFVYVDGDHTHEGVSKDIKNYWPKLLVGGRMAFDDYTLSGWWGDGVVKAVHALVKREQCKIVLAMDNQIVIERIA